MTVSPGRQLAKTLMKRTTVIKPEIVRWGEGQTRSLTELPCDSLAAAGRRPWFKRVQVPCHCQGLGPRPRATVEPELFPVTGRGGRENLQCQSRAVL
jgi:hypothetical protein